MQKQKRKQGGSCACVAPGCELKEACVYHGCAGGNCIGYLPSGVFYMVPMSFAVLCVRRGVISGHAKNMLGSTALNGVCYWMVNGG